MTDETLDTLRHYDAAPFIELAPADIDRRETLLFAVLADAAPRSRSRRRGFRWTSLGLGAALAGAAAFGIVAVAPHLTTHPPVSVPQAAGDGPLTAADLATWTSTPGHLSSSSSLATSAQAWCATALNEGQGDTTARITNLDSRGAVASMLYRENAHIYYCTSSGNGVGMWDMGDTAPAAGNTLASNSILIDSAGSHGNGDLGITYAYGFAGPDVAKVTVNEPNSAPITATVQDGYWTAWWPQPSAQAHGGPSGTVSITTTAGTTRAVPAASIYQK